MYRSLLPMTELQSIADDSTDIAQLPETDRYRLLSNERRRATLTVLAERTTPLRIDDLATAVAQRVIDDDPEMEFVERVKISLHHSHLPKMDYLDVLEYDPDAKIIR